MLVNGHVIWKSLSPGLYMYAMYSKRCIVTDQKLTEKIEVCRQTYSKADRNKHKDKQIDLQ